MEEMGTLTKQKDTLDVALQFSFAITSFDVTEERLRFDEHSFIADVGGFLGLLLGASVYSMYLALVSGYQRVLVYWKG